MLKSKKGKAAVAIVAVLLVLVAVWVFVLPYVEAESTMPADSRLMIHQQEDGTLQLSWPAAEKADHYLVEVVRLTEEEETILHSGTVTGETFCLLPQLPAGETLTIRVNTMVGYDFPGEEKFRPGSVPLKTELCLDPPVIKNLQWTPYPNADTVHITFPLPQGDGARLYRVDEQGKRTLVKTLHTGDVSVTFGKTCDFPMLEHGQQLILELEPFRVLPDSEFIGQPSEQIVITREHLLETNLQLEVTEQGRNVYTLTWNETRGAYYEVQVMDNETMQWTTLHRVEQTGERSYTTDHLMAFHTYHFRVVAKDGILLPGSEKYAAISRYMEFKTSEALIYATIWPLKNLDVYSAADMTEVIGSVSAGSTLCVLDEQNGAFEVRISEGQTGFIDSNYCMINLADYLGELCSYDITNSYSSKYKIHQYDIRHVTYEVIGGYERVRMADGTFLVPLLYPTAQKLQAAALSAQERGCRLKIYDAYRPNRATVYLYDTAEKLLEDPVPGNIPDPTEEDPDQLLTYGKAMTMGIYPLNYFLARGASLHNLGIAVDLTIESLETGEEMPMQTAMHDLSYHSANYNNNANATILSEVMLGAGMGDLFSEWWHFQDNDSRSNLILQALWGGISPEGWMADDHGWRYRQGDGTYASDCTLTIGETEYTFDENGYVTEN